MFNKEFLKEVLGVQSYSGDYHRMLKFITDYLDKKSDITYRIDRYDNIYVTKGKADIYPCVVAHTDTVHRIIKNFKVVEVEGAIFGWNVTNMSMSGIGGDDKVGIFLALSCLEYFDNIKLVFFADEEVGCVGSSFADMDFFKDCTLVLQGDRRGNNEFINDSNSCELFGDEFKQAVQPILSAHQYKFGTGTITDVGQLKQDGLDIACANVACGYYNAHTHDEVVNIQDVKDCLNLFIDVIDRLGSVKRWEHTYTYVPFDYESFRKSYYGKKKGKSEADELEEIADKIDQGITVRGICPSCKSENDFYGWFTGNQVACGSCCSEVALDDVEVTLDYEEAFYNTKSYDDKESDDLPFNAEKLPDLSNTFSKWMDRTYT